MLQLVLLLIVNNNKNNNNNNNNNYYYYKVLFCREYSKTFHGVTVYTENSLNRATSILFVCHMRVLCPINIALHQAIGTVL